MLMKEAEMKKRVMARKMMKSSPRPLLRSEPSISSNHPMKTVSKFWVLQ